MKDGNKISFNMSFKKISNEEERKGVINEEKEENEMLPEANGLLL